MSTPPSSRAATTVPPSLADVLVAIAAADLPARRKQDLASAVRSAARALGRPPEQVPADPRLLASRLGELAPLALGFSKPRWNNLRSLLRASLELVTAMAPGRHLAPLSPAWQALWDRLPTRTLKTRLSRLLHDCSGAGIEPEAVDDATFAAFRAHLELTLLKEPAAVYRETLLGWNKARIRARHVPGRRKRDRMVGAYDLLTLGCTLMATAPALTTDRLRAMQFRDGLIIAVLAARPLRLSNLTGLDLERTLTRRGEAWWIDIPAEETKTREPIEAPWPEALTAPLMMYLDVYRPILCRLTGRWTRPVDNALWVSTNASPMGQMAVYQVIVGRTAAAFGQSINPHLFRDCAATSIAIDDPAHVRIASQILGHRSTATTEKYYNQAQAIDAARRYQDFLVALRQGRMIDNPELTES